MMQQRTLAKEIIYGTEEGVALLIKQGEEINVMDEYGYTPLIEAVMFDKTKIVEAFLKLGATIDSPDLTGRTALHWAVDDNNLAMAQLLLDNQADPNAYTKSCQPVLVFPILRQQEPMKDLLYRYGAKLDFAQDYINTKLIGHRFELEGQVHIVDADKRFILLDYEGFFLEFTLSIIEDSLRRYRNNFAAKHWHTLFHYFEVIVDCLRDANQLLRLQHFSVQKQNHDKEVFDLLEKDLVLIPVAYEGHAITCVKCGDLWLKCDRGYNSKIEGSVVIYRITQPQKVDKYFMKNLLSQKHSRQYVNEGLNQEIGLMKIAELPLPAQIIGNCSWANVEGSIPSMLFLLLLKNEKHIDAQTLIQCIDLVMKFFDEWREWDKDRSLEDCIRSFHHANAARRASKAALLSAVLAQKCFYTHDRDIKRAEKILPILAIPEYQYNLKAYLKVYYKENRTELGENLVHLLDLASPAHSSFLDDFDLR